jgi:hypothetical protein
MAKALLRTILTVALCGLTLGVACSKDPGSVGTTENGGASGPMAGGAGDGAGQGGLSGRTGGASGFSGIHIDNAVNSVKGNVFDKGVKVFVVGIAIDDATVATLNRMAEAGGAGSYFPVDSPEALKDALQKISGIVASCTFAVKVRLDAGRPDPQSIAVFLDGERLPNDDTDGWVLTNNDTEVELKGKYCAAIKSGAGTKVQVLVGCAPIPAGTIP